MGLEERHFHHCGLGEGRQKQIHLRIERVEGEELRELPSDG